MSNFLAWLVINFLSLGVVGFGVGYLIRIDYVDRTGITYVIAGIYVVFYLANFLNTWSVRRHRRWMKAAAEPTPGPGATPQGSTTAGVIFEGRGLYAEHIARLNKMYENLSVGEVRQDVSLDVLHNRLVRRESFVQLGSNLMITLGLIGTITGLIISMTGLEDVMASVASAEKDIVPGLRQALSGMGTAFYTTLLGAVLGGVLLKLLHQATTNLMMELTDDISIATETLVLPYLKKDLDVQAVKSREQLERFCDEMTVTSTAKCEELERLCDSMTTLVTTRVSLLEGFCDGMTDSLGQQIKNIDLAVQAQSALLSSLEECESLAAQLLVKWDGEQTEGLEQIMENISTQLERLIELADDPKKKGRKR